MNGCQHSKKSFSSKGWRFWAGRGPRRITRGPFPSAAEAARAYDACLLEMYGDFALTNEKIRDVGFTEAVSKRDADR